MIVSFIKRLKLSYLIYNLFHKKELIHNVPVYRKYGLKKKYYSSVSSKDFTDLPVLDPIVANENKLKESIIYKESGESSKKSILSYNRNGYVIVNEFLKSEEVDLINREVKSTIESGKIKEAYGSRYLQIVKESKAIHEIAYSKRLTELCDILLDGESLFFQSINFIKGSEQDTHSDSYHMTTYPEGGLLGIWIALEDIGHDQGPLHYYPGSQCLPYFLNESFDNEGTMFMLGKHNYPPYAAMIKKKIRENKFEKEVFIAKKGDLLIWHANLLHGGEPHKNLELSRKSMVLHYLKKDVICYHEILQRPALIRF
jgi:phytanoyl-CoA hydroxylase